VPAVEAVSDVAAGDLGELSIGAVVRLAVGADVGRMVAHDPIARLGHDVEGVHQARVATRRLRSHLATFAPVLRPAPVQRLSKELRWLGRALGLARDLDVLADRFARTVDSFEPLTKEDGLVLLGVMAVDRAAAAQALAGVLASRRYRELLGELARTVAGPPFLRSAGLPAEEFLAGAVASRLADLAAAIGALSATPMDAQLHQVRIIAKPARYVAELSGPVLGEDCARLARRLADLSDALGLLHDGARANEWLDEVGADPLRAIAVVRIRAVEIDRMNEARDAWPRRWERVRAAAAAMGMSGGPEPRAGALDGRISSLRS